MDIDTRVIREMKKRTGPRVTRDSVNIFVRDVSFLFLDLKNARENCMIPRFRDTARLIRQSATRIGALRLATLASELENTYGFPFQSRIDQASEAFEQASATLLDLCK